MITYKKFKIPDLLLIQPEVFNDNRGFFFESFNQKDFEAAVGRQVNFVQDNHSKSSQGVLRGLHYQKHPCEQGKYVRVVQGEVWDVAVDLRKNSNTFGEWVGEYLSAENKKQLWIPEGFAHGFVVVSEFAEVLYKVTSFYNKEHDQSIIWNDEILNIKWPISSNLIISKKDSEAKSFKDADYFE
jgi:dTDP-4-dehydrorhamnose 3,5-epimerase